MPPIVGGLLRGEPPAGFHGVHPVGDAATVVAVEPPLELSLELSLEPPPLEPPPLEPLDLVTTNELLVAD